MPETSKEAQGPKFDDVFQWIQSFGCRQRILFSGVNLILIPVSLQFMLLVFGMGTPSFHCTSNSTCQVGKCCDNCTSYQFDGPFKSAVSEFNLICDRAYIGATVQSCFFIGMLVGSIPGGWVSDTYGRRKCLLLNSGIMFVCAIGTYFADCPSLLAFLRFGVGYALVAIMLCEYIYVMELVGPNKRTFSGKVVDLFWDVGDVVCFVMAYLIRDWRMLILACTMFIVPYLFSWRILPESARWLVANNQIDQACDELLKYGVKEGEQVEREQVKGLLEEVKEYAKTQQEQNDRKYTPLDLFRTPKIRRRSLIICFNWFVISLVYFGFYLYITALSGDIYVNFLVMGLLTIPNLPISFFLMKAFGRRVVFIGYMLLSSILCLSVLIIPKGSSTAILAIAITGRVLNSCCFNNVYLYTSELYPTVIRNAGVGTGSTCARIGAILSPYIVMLSQLPGVSVTLPVSIFGVCGLAASILSFWLPETMCSPMHQTISEAEANTDYFGVQCMWRKERQDFKVQKTRPDKELDSLI